MTSEKMTSENTGTPRPAMPDLSDLIADPGKPPRAADPRRRTAVLASVAGLALLAIGVLAGYYAAPRGPATLAAAVQEAQSGQLPCGTPSAPAAGTTGTAAGGRGGAFLVARLCQSTATAAAPGTTGPVPGSRGGLGGLFGPGSLNGTITSMDAGSLTVQTRAGDVKVALPSTATISKTTAGQLSDLKSGERIVVQSSQDASGNRTATSVFVLPATGGTTG